MSTLKFGAHIFLWIDQWNEKNYFLMKQAKDLGLNVLEIAIGNDVFFDHEKIKLLGKDLGMEIVVSPGGIWPNEADISSDNPEHRAFGLEWHKTWIDNASKAGAIAYTGAIYGHPGRVEKRRPSQDEWNRAIENLIILAEFAETRNVKLVLEPMSHFRTNLVNTLSQVYKMLDDVHHDNLYALIDTYHLATEIREFSTGIKLLSDKIWGIHACENDRGVPGNGLIPWKKILEELKSLNFQGYFIFESYNSTIQDGNFAYSRGMFHHVCPDGNEFVKQGASFIQNMWDSI